jgi:hypothetical protein
LAAPDTNTTNCYRWCFRFFARTFENWNRIYKNRPYRLLSVVAPIADKRGRNWIVRFVPGTDIFLSLVYARSEPQSWRGIPHRGGRLLSLLA